MFVRTRTSLFGNMFSFLRMVLPTNGVYKKTLTVNPSHSCPALTNVEGEFRGRQEKT